MMVFLLSDTLQNARRDLIDQLAQGYTANQRETWAANKILIKKKKIIQRFNSRLQNDEPEYTFLFMPLN